MLDDQQVALYLERIGYRDSRKCDLSVLNALHTAHMLSVPFENLDIILGQQINLNLDALFDKIVLKHRGGFCYELNTLFRALLLRLGFKVRFLSARVFNGSHYGSAFDHMLLLVNIENVDVIVDVGFGDSFKQPLPLSGAAQTQNDVSYFLKGEGGEYILHREKILSHPVPLYRFSADVHELDAFEQQCNFHQTSPESHFTQHALCSVATSYGRQSIRDGYFIDTCKGIRNGYQIKSETEYRLILKDKFRMSLHEDANFSIFFGVNPI
ncbi:arylamine N-acetyltransferase [Undibacterium jejuense]|uniref:Arylamine N-acetyltransferase n=1 Tax=Undibacterium jejuense TaxID=1344949 RepID=A0A923HJQ6_9BURK|nr:arylamine N-acetyltransferase [Undibacterium jejuense]MBC3863495.1 arylamine N-acetyltransferase [Undibacterium jejuense]